MTCRLSVSSTSSHLRFCLQSTNLHNSSSALSATSDELQLLCERINKEQITFTVDALTVTQQFASSHLFYCVTAFIALSKFSQNCLPAQEGKFTSSLRWTKPEHFFHFNSWCSQCFAPKLQPGCGIRGDVDELFFCRAEVSWCCSDLLDSVIFCRILY